MNDTKFYRFKDKNGNWFLMNKNNEDGVVYRFPDGKMYFNTQEELVQHCKDYDVKYYKYNGLIKKWRELEKPRKGFYCVECGKKIFGQIYVSGGKGWHYCIHCANKKAYYWKVR